MRDDRQDSLFELAQDWQEHWKGMPEFVQEAQEPYQAILVRFSCKADVEDFAAKLGQKITERTNHIWHPALTVKKLTKEIIGP